MAETEPLTSAQSVEALREAAETALACKDWPVAAAAYEKLLDAEPKNSAHRFNLVRAYDELGRPEDALEVLQHPSIAHLEKTKRRLARTYVDLKNYGAAIRLVDELIAAHPENPKFAKWKAVLDEKSGPDAAAAERMQHAQSFLDGGRPDEAEPLLLHLLDDYPAFARAGVALGKLYAQQKRWGEAIPLLRAGLASDPGNRKLRTTLARAFLKNGQARSALAVLECDGPDESVDALFLLQRCHLELQNWNQSFQIGERLLGLLEASDPDRPRVEVLTDEAAVRRVLATIAATSDPADGRAIDLAYRAVAARHPDSALPWIALGAAHSEVGRHEEAAAALRDGRLQHPASIDIRTALSRAVIAAGDEQATLEHVREAAVDQGGDFEALRWLASYNAERRAWVETVDPARRALAFEPQNGRARVALVHALVHLGRLPEALGELRPLLASGEKQVEALQLKGDILMRLARLREALEAYQQAAELAPKDPVLARSLAEALLLTGDVKGFHRWHERRRERPGSPEIPEWHGELNIDGRLLVWADPADSLGTQVLQLRFLDQLLALGFDLVLEVDERLASVCRRSFPQFVVVIGNDSDLPPGIKLQTALDGLFRWFKPDRSSISNQQPYLIPDAASVEAVRSRAAVDDGQLLIGVEWPTPAVIEAITSSGRTIIDLEECAPTAGELAVMDLVVCSDGDTAHLAGALGVPCLILLPPIPSPYWEAAGDRSLWYPSAKLLRRTPFDEDWSAIISEAAAAVERFVPEERIEIIPRSELSPEDLAEAAYCFIAQGPQHHSAYRSALTLIERIPHKQMSSELKLARARLLMRAGEWQQARALLEAMQVPGLCDQEIARMLLSVCLAMYDLGAGLQIARALAAGAPEFGVTAANILFLTGRDQETIAELEKVAVVAPDLERVSALFGTCLLETGQVERAAAYLAGQAAASGRARDYALLGRALAQLGNEKEATAAFDSAIAASPEDPAANFWRTLHRIECAAIKRVPLPTIEGEIPHVHLADRVIFFVADNDYFWKHGRILLASLARQSPAAKCHVHVVNPNTEVAAAIAETRAKIPGLSYSHEIADLAGCDEVHARTYYASIRFVRLAELFTRAPATYLCVDSDCIIRGDVAAAPLEVTDIGIRFRYSDEPHASVAAGALVLSPTDRAARFIDRVASLIGSVLETDEAAWFLDQVALSQVVREIGREGDVSFTQIDMAWVDWFFHDEALIWTGKGPRKFEDARYVAEMRRYRSLFPDQHDAI